MRFHFQEAQINNTLSSAARRVLSSIQSRSGKPFLNAVRIASIISVAYNWFGTDINNLLWLSLTYLIYLGAGNLNTFWYNWRCGCKVPLRDRSRKFGKRGWKHFAKSATSLHTHNKWTPLGWLHNTTQKITSKKKLKIQGKKGGVVQPPRSAPLNLPMPFQGH